LDKVVRWTGEETLNALLDAEADQLCQASRDEQAEKRQDTRLAITSGIWRPKPSRRNYEVSKLRTLSFETAIIERYRRRESSVKDALIGMCLAGASVRRVEITETLWGDAGQFRNCFQFKQEGLCAD